MPILQLLSLESKIVGAAEISNFRPGLGICYNALTNITDTKQTLPLESRSEWSGASSSLFTYCPFFSTSLLGSTVVSPYVGMAIKQNGGYNASISVQTLIFHLVVNSTRLKTVRSGRWCCPNYTMAPRLVENVVKVTNLEVVKIEFRHLPFLLSFFLQPA